MKVEIIQIGDTKDSSILALEAEYEKRLSRSIQLKSTSLKASKSDERDRAQSEEAERILEKISDSAHVIALDETGKQLSSEAFAEHIREQRDFGPGQIQFIIGGSNGLSPQVLSRADFILSFSKMTFTHEMIRPFLKEQLYRAYAILDGRRYHK